MNKSMTFLTGTGLGAMLMYMFDPGQGAGRRTAVGLKAKSSLHATERSVKLSARDLSNRSRGVSAGIRSRFTNNTVSDETLVARVRSQLGRISRNARLIDVTASSGFVTIHGPVLSTDVKYLIRHVAGVRGVKGVENKLDVYENAADLTGFHPVEVDPAVKRFSWRWISGLAGGGLATYGMIRRDKLGWGLSTAGMGLILAGASRRRSRRTMRHTGEITVRKSILIHAPVGDVYGYWSNIDNFPLFMTNVRNVEDRGNGFSHWKVAGPGGTTFEWEAHLVENVENELISWESLPGSSIRNSGRVRFFPEGDGATRVEIHLSYAPPAGVLGHSIARLFGSDPRSEMDEDLVRMKTLIETGNPPHDAADPLLKEAREHRES